MVLYQPATGHKAVDVKVCSISFQRHSNSVLGQQKKHQKNLIGRRHNPGTTTMADSQSNQLPVVELRPFTKKVWRREKSLPDFYERKTISLDESSGGTISKGSSLDISSTTSRLVRELTDVRKSLDTRQNTMDPSLGKFRCHPKAEFCHESNKAWRKQDLIPGFITRFERTRTSMEILSKENSSLQQNLPMSSDDLWCNNTDTSGQQNNSGIRVKGGKMNKQIYRRHFLYLNPLDTYRQPSSWSTHFNSTDNSRHSTGRQQLAPSRNSFPLSSGRARELFLSGSHFNHPLKPIQRDENESPHKFNSKLGAARSSLQILNKLGAPTKLEKALEMEYELNLERYRKDRLFLPQDFRLLSNNNVVQFDTNPTIGETLLRTAREANKPKKRSQQGEDRTMGVVKEDSNAWYRNDAPVPEIQRGGDSHLVNQSMHPINTVLHEESEPRYTDLDSTKAGFGNSETSKLIPGLANTNNGALEQSQSIPNVSADSSHGNDRQANVISNSDINVDVPSLASLNQLENNVETSVVQQDGSIILKNVNINNNNDTNNNNITTTHRISPVDSSRLETNIDYLNNLQRKSVSASSCQRPTSKPEEKVAAAAVVAAATNPRLPHLEMIENEVHDDAPNDGNGHTKTTGRLEMNAASGETVNASNELTLTQQAQDTTDSSKLDHTHNLESDAVLVDTQTLGDQDSKKKEVSDPVSQTLPDYLENMDENDLSHNRFIPAQTVDLTVSKNQQNESISCRDLPEPKDNSLSTESKPRRVIPEGKNESQKANSVARSAVMTSKIISPEGNHNSNGTGDMNALVAPEEGEKEEGADAQRIAHNEKEKDGNLNDKSNDESLLVPALEVNFQGASETKTDQSGGHILEDEGISMATPIERAVLDSSMTEACSDQEGNTSISADNGDSGISTTFITADESRPSELESLMVYD